MIEISGMVGWVSAALLFAAIAAWLKLGRRPPRQPLNVRATRDDGRVEDASRLLVIAVACCAVAAVLAIAGWMFG
jgi:hypothetical protein